MPSRYKALTEFSIYEEELKPIDEIVERFLGQKFKVLDEGLLSKITNFLTATPDLRPSFGAHAAEYSSLRRELPNKYSKYLENPTEHNGLMVQIVADSLNREADFVNELYSDALARNLVDEGLGQKLAKLEGANKECERKFIEAQRRVKQLEAYIRLHNGNPDDANDTIVSDPFEGGDNH